MVTVGWLRPLGRIVERMLRPRLHSRLPDLRRILEVTSP